MWPPALCSRRHHDDRGLSGRRRFRHERPTGPGCLWNEPGHRAVARFVPGRWGPCRDGGAPPEGRRGRPALSGCRHDKHGIGGLPPRMVTTTELVTRRTRPTGRVATGREQRSSRWEDGRRRHGPDGNFHGEEERNGDECDGRASAGASAGREAKYCHRRGRQRRQRRNVPRAVWPQHTLCSNFKHRKE